MTKRKPDRNPSGFSRTDRAETALQIHSCLSGVDWSQSPAEAWTMKSKEEHLTDLLTDLMHWAEENGGRKNLDFCRCYLMAARHYDAEMEGRK